MTLPQPRQLTEAHLAAIVGRTTDPTFCRFFLLETAEGVLDQREFTVIGEWGDRTHKNNGEGPPFTGDLVSDHDAFVNRLSWL